MAMGQTNINVGNITGNSGTLAIGNNISITVTNVSELLRSFLPITPSLIDDKQAMRGIWQMGAPEWPFFKRDWRASEDVPRKLYYDLFQRITNPPNPTFPYLQLLLADSGWGKSILMMRLAADLCRLDGYGVLWLRPTASDQAASFTPQISEVATRLGSGRKLFVLIDDILAVTKLGIFLQELLNLPAAAAQVIVVGSGQADELANTYTNPYDIHAILATFVATPTDPDLDLLPFDNDELRQLVVFLNDNQQLCPRLPHPLAWGDNVLDTLGPPLTPPLVANDYPTLYQPRQAMCLLTKGEQIQAQVARQLGEMQGRGDFRQPEQRNPMVNLYDQVTLFYRTGTPASRAWLEAAAQRDPQLATALNAVYSGQYPIAGIMQVQTDGSLIAAHPLDAQAATALLHPDQQSQQRAYAGLLGFTPPAAQGDALKMLHGLLGSSNAANAAQSVNLVRGILTDAGGKVPQLIAAANPYQLGSGWSSLYRRIGDLPSATNMASTVINHGGLAQDIGPAHYNRALAHQAAGRSDLAAADFAKAKELLRLPPNTVIPPLQPSPAPPMQQTTVTTITTTAGMAIGLKVLIGVLVAVLLGGAGWLGVKALGGSGPATPTPTPPVALVATSTLQSNDTPQPSATMQSTDTPLPSSITPIALSDAELLKRGIAVMRAAQSYHFEYNAATGQSVTSLTGDVDLANQRSQATYSDGQQAYQLITIGTASYISTDTGQTWSVASGRSVRPTPLNNIISIWTNFSDAAIDRAAPNIKDGNPPTFDINGVTTRHMIVPLSSIIANNADTLAPPAATIEFWVMTAAPYDVLQLEIIQTGAVLGSVNIRWSQIGATFPITPPPVAAPTDTPTAIPAPRAYSPAVRSIYRGRAFAWDAVNVPNVTYSIEIQINDNGWSTFDRQSGLTSTSYSTAKPLADYTRPWPSRWQVWASTSNGGEGNKSIWQEFTLNLDAADYSGYWVNDANNAGDLSSLTISNRGQELDITRICSAANDRATLLFDGEPLLVAFKLIPATPPSSNNFGTLGCPSRSINFDLSPAGQLEGLEVFTAGSGINVRMYRFTYTFHKEQSPQITK